MMLKTLCDSLSHRAAVAYRTRSIPLRNPRPVVTMSFDDCPLSAVTTGARLLESRGVRGSFYLSGGLSGRTWDNGPQFVPEHVQTLAARGHEIGCHTFNHLDCAAASRADIRRDIAANRTFLQQLLPEVPVTTFAYPYGRVSLTAKVMLQQTFAACRGVTRGLNSGTADLGLLKAVALSATAHDAAAARAGIAPWLERARGNPAWLVLYTHDVVPQPTPFGCTPDTLAATLDAVLEAGFEILPLKDAVARLTLSDGTAAAGRPADAAKRRIGFAA
jgi:peptidoglycan/xylan/chitin deacetylase (PgdA/CDA1 family)